ncbi:hypothetical protein CGCVW01_v007392 [Colletotrichum viniferum]|nr:hypothetical protein CGCVW01_v007392 [Colletotrichum viniferum]
MLWSLQAPHAAVMVKPTPCLIDGCPSTSTNKHTQYTLAYLPQYSMPPSINYPAGLETLLPLDRQWPAHHHHFHPSHPYHHVLARGFGFGCAPARLSITVWDDEKHHPLPTGARRPEPVLWPDSPVLSSRSLPSVRKGARR